MATLLEIFFLPPMAIGRLGSSATPLDCFRWSENANPHSQADTVIESATSLKVQADGSVVPYLPSTIIFKDEDGAIRPVAPFFELWATLENDQTGEVWESPVTLGLLGELKCSLSDIQYEITVANRKAARRTGYAPCGFMAREVVHGDDHAARPLLGISPHTSGQEPLVGPDNPIPLGHFQVMRPVDGKIRVSAREPEVDRSILRVRFTPAKGIVYGPPEATSAPAPQVQPGQFEAPIAEYGRIHEIVAPKNRIISGKTPWSSYKMLNGRFEDPQPQDGYDGANVGDHKSWGCADDVCDGVVVATLGFEGRLYRAFARVFASPPDFAPDRRPIFSIADDLADRELPPLGVTKASVEVAIEEVLDIFKRAFETASLFNLDAARARALLENRVRFALHTGDRGQDRPKAGKESMTSEDCGYIDKLPTLDPMAPSYFTNATPNNEVPYTSVLPFIHAPLQDRETLIDLLRLRGNYIKRLVRPPFGRFTDLPQMPADRPNPRFRDPRVFRDQLHDMRMPPYMRDAARQPLSLTYRQYRLLEELIDYLESHPGDFPQLTKTDRS